MDIKHAITNSYETERMVSMAYLQDLTDEEMMHRPCPGANHIKWQIGHLIVSEHGMLEKAYPGSMAPLPAGFAEKYTKETSSIDDPAAFNSKEELLATAHAQRAGTVTQLEKVSSDEFSKETGIEYAPTVLALFNLQGAHWLMHAGQWAVVRRQLGRPPLF